MRRVRDLSSAAGGFVDIAEFEYSRAFMYWENTSKWNVLSRWFRKREYELWLRAMFIETERHMSS